MQLRWGREWDPRPHPRSPRGRDFSPQNSPRRSNSSTYSPTGNPLPPYFFVFFVFDQQLDEYEEHIINSKYKTKFAALMQGLGFFFGYF